MKKICFIVVMLSTFIQVATIFFFAYHYVKNLPSVKTPIGKIIGTNKFSHHGRKFDAYEGVPYALPPVGKRKFEVKFYDTLKYFAF